MALGVMRMIVFRNSQVVDVKKSMYCVMEDMLCISVFV